MRLFRTLLVGILLSLCFASTASAQGNPSAAAATDNKEDADANGWFREYLSKSDDHTKKTSASLQGRGNSSWMSKYKKSYSLRLDKSMNLLGMGSNKNWNLIGNSADASLMKNIVFNKVARDAGIEYQPEMRSVVLYVDAQYRGVYTLTSKVTVGKNRVALKKGDMFYRLDPPVQDQPILYSSQTWFEDGLTYPVADLLYPEEADEFEMYRAQSVLQDFINTVENPESARLSEVCDIRSLARYYWVEEASMNFDAWERSTYFYYTQNDGKIHMGPVWDMDLTLGNQFEKAGMMFTTPEGWRVRNAGWYTRLFQNPEFVQAVVDEYQNGVRSALFDGIEEFRRQKQTLLAEGNMNYAFFGEIDDYAMRNIYDDAGEYDKYCEDIIAFYEARLAWIDGQRGAGVLF